MKYGIYFYCLVFFIAAITFFTSCRKDSTCGSCAAINFPPKAHAGPDQQIRTKDSVVLLDGTGSKDADGQIVLFQWKKILGPPSYHIENEFSAKTKINAFTAGTYQFELTVVDDDGLSGKDTLIVAVKSDTPVANAGPDQAIAFPACTGSKGIYFFLYGGNSLNCAAYHWKIISGPGVYSIENENSALTKIIDPVEGTYIFELTVTGSGGLLSKDTVSVVTSYLAKIYDLDLEFNFTFTFIPKEEQCDDYCVYYAITSIAGNGSFAPLGDFRLDVSEMTDTAVISNEHKTTLGISYGEGARNYASGDCTINFKNLITQGGGNFNGAVKINSGSAGNYCSNLLYGLDPLTVIGSLDTLTKTGKLHLKGKIYF